MTRRRWPEAECLHEHTHGPDRIMNGRGQYVRTVPERCIDCGYRFPGETDIDTPC